MRVHNGRYECVLCGVVLDVPIDEKPIVMIAAASGEPTMRTIVFAGVEVHRCPISTPRRPARA
jgi:hypothetical protein